MGTSVTSVCLSNFQFSVGSPRPLSDIRQVRLPLHPGDWFSQNVALGYRLVFSNLKPDLIVVDHSARYRFNLSVFCFPLYIFSIIFRLNLFSCVPMLKWRFPKSKVLFYCHFPQQLVTPSRFFLYRWYSTLIGLIEARLYESADVIMVNSKYTGTDPSFDSTPLLNIKIS